MDYNTIKKLLDKYWEGETSVQEETQLKRYFNGANVADELKQFQSLFTYFEQSGQQTSKQNFDHLDTTAARSLIPQRLMVAASILLLVVAGFTYNFTETPVEDPALMADTYKDPKVAYEEAKAALMLISTKLNKGINKTTETVRKVRE